MRMCILFYRNLLLKHYHCLRWMHNKNSNCLGNSRGRQAGRQWRLRMRVKVIAVSPVPSTLLFFVDGNGAEESKGRGSWVTRRGALLLLGNPPVADHCCLGAVERDDGGKGGKEQLRWIATCSFSSTSFTVCASFLLVHWLPRVW